MIIFTPHRVAPEVDAPLWEAYTASRSTEDRNRLVELYVPLVFALAKEMHIKRSLPDHVDPDELASHGFEGLLRAVERFEPARGFQFQTYATRRIVGSILDGIRNLDWVPRLSRSRHREVSVQEEWLRNELERDPTPEELTDALSGGSKDADVLLKSRHMTQLISFQAKAVDDDGNPLILDRGNPHHAFEVVDARDEIEHCWMLLPREEQDLLALLSTGRTFANIAVELSCSESRISQLRNALFRTLRPQLRASFQAA